MATQAHGEGGRLVVCEAELTVQGGGHCLAAQTAGLPREHLETTAQRERHGRETGITLHEAGARADPPRGPEKEPAPAPRTMSTASSFRTRVPADD